MSYGLSVQSSSGDIQIDQDFRNFQVIAEGTGATIASGSLSNYYEITFTATANPPLICTRSTTYAVFCPTLIKDGSGNYHKARIYSYATLVSSVTFDWFVAAPLDALSGDAWGMQVFDATGAKVFDSGAKYLRILDVVPFDLGAFETGAGLGGGGTYLPVTHASAAGSYCVLNGLRGFISNTIAEYSATFFPAALNYSSTEVRIEVGDRAFTATWSPDPYTRHDAHLVVCSM